MANANVFTKHGGKRHIYPMPAALRARFATRNVVDKVSGCGVEDNSPPVHARGVPRTGHLHYTRGDDATIPDAMPARTLQDDRTPVAQLHALAVVVGGATASAVAVVAICACAYFGKLPHCKWHHAVTLAAAALAASLQVVVQIVVVFLGVAAFFVKWDRSTPAPERDVESDVLCNIPADCANFF